MIAQRRGEKPPKRAEKEAAGALAEPLKRKKGKPVGLGTSKAKPDFHENRFR
jgi:hypothetical protein